MMQNLSDVSLPQVDFPERDVIKALRDDLILLEELLEGSPNMQFLRRSLVRASFALIEAHLNNFKALAHNLATQLILPLQEQLGRVRQLCPVRIISQNITTCETALLRDEEVRVKSNGDIEYGRLNLDFKKNAKFTLRSACRVFGFDFMWDLEHEAGWSALVSAADIRNRLLHPRPGDSMDVEDGELECVRKAYTWVVSADIDFMLRAQVETAQACRDIVEWVRDFAPEFIEQVRKDMAYLEVFHENLPDINGAGDS